MLQELKGGACRDDRDVGVQVEELCDGAGVIGLGVVHDQVIDLGDRGDGFDVADHLVEEGLLGGLEESGLLAALEKVGIVGRAVSGLHDNVEYTQLGVKDAGPVQVLLNFESFHGSPP